MTISFENFLNKDMWKTLNSHIKDFPTNLDTNIAKAIENDKKEDLRKWLLNKYDIKNENDDIKEKLRNELHGGNVVAIDGTCVDCDLITGFQARIGIVAVNYKNNRTDYVTYISEPFIDYSKTDIREQLEYLKLKGAGKAGITSSHIRAIMLFKERDFILNRIEKYKMVQGDILPYELRTGQGKLRGLNSCLQLGRKLLNENNIVAVQTTTSRPELRLVGTALESGEYIELYDYFNTLNAFIEGDEFTQPAHFNDDDKKMFLDFNEDVRNKFSVGIYKIKNRAYVYYAPKNNFEIMTNLIFADCKYQALRGFPLLLDYADIICSKLFSASDFLKIVQMKLARQKKLEFEINEKSLRRR